MRLIYLVEKVGTEAVAGRFGLSQTLDTSVGDRQIITDFEPPKPVDDVAFAHVGDETTVERTVKGDGYDTLSLNIVYEGTLHPYFNEMHQNTRQGQTITIEPDGLNGHADSYTCYRTDKNGLRYYNKSCEFYVLQWSLRTLNQA